MTETPRSWAEEFARDMIAKQKVIGHPVITRCAHSATGLPSFCEGTPYLLPENLEFFIRALKPEISLMEVTPARKVFRKIGEKEKYPTPEACTPYVDANSLGFYLKTVLPLVFVRTRKNEPLLDARVALKYLRENWGCFSEVLENIASSARSIFRPSLSEARTPTERLLLTDIAQPYTAFTERHISLRAGLWVQTPKGVSTVIGPPVNCRGPLSVLTGAVETDWHHFELFVVAELPDFTGQVLVVPQRTTIAQLYFVAREAGQDAEIAWSPSDPGSDPEYAASWDAMGARLVNEGRGTQAECVGTASVQMSCPHCFVSVTAATESDLLEGHVLQRGFNPAYKILQRERRALDHTRETQCSLERDAD